MPLLINAAVTWIRPDYGGRGNPPSVGLRPGIRFQRDISSWLSCSWSVQIVELNFDVLTWSGTVKFGFSESVSPDCAHIKTGELIELMDGHRVIGVGMILSVIEG